MMTTIRGFWRNFIGQKEPEVVETAASAALSADAASPPPATQINNVKLDIAPNDLLLAYVQQNPGVIDVAQLKLDSPALNALRVAGIRVIVPLVSQGELIGLINLGSRLSEQEYSSDDHKLLTDLAAQAAPGSARGPTRETAAGGSGGTGTDRAGTARRPTDSANPAAAGAAGAGELARDRLLPAGTGSRGRFLQISSSSPTARSASLSPMSPTKGCRPPW
jgi:hypothetical protein